MTQTTPRRRFGAIRRLPSGNVQAFYTDPDGRTHISRSGKITPVRYSKTFAPASQKREDVKDAELRAENWLQAERKLIREDEWTTPEARELADAAEARRVEASRLPALEEYASRWIDERRVKGRPLAERTKDAYRDYLRRFVSPTFGHLSLDEITPEAVNKWHDTLDPRRKGRKGDTGEAQRAKVYSFLRAVMNSATSATGPMPGRVNPVAVRGGGTGTARRRDDQTVTGTEFAVMLESIRDDRRAMLLLALWCGLRFSELAALRRPDIDLKAGIVKVNKAVERSRSGVRDKSPKSEAGYRDVRIPAHVLPDIKAHLRANVSGRNGLVFPGSSGGYLSPAAFYGKPGGKGWYGARAAAGRVDVRFHDLRASGATLLAHGATEAEVQVWLGDSTPQAAQRYMRATRSRMDKHAERMSEIAKDGQW